MSAHRYKPEAGQYADCPGQNILHVRTGDAFRIVTRTGSECNVA